MFALILALMLKAAVPPGKGVVVDPSWAQTPDPDLIAAAYPEVAERYGVEGVALVQCKVAPEGRPHDCEVLQAAPAGLGFDEAALKVAPSFHFHPQTVDGRPTGDGEVTIPLHFLTQTASGAAPLSLKTPYRLRPAAAGEAMPSTATGPCPDGSGRLCVATPFAWAKTPSALAQIGLYGIVEVACAVKLDGSMDDCRGVADSPGAKVQTALHVASLFRAPTTGPGAPKPGDHVGFRLVSPLPEN